MPVDQATSRSVPSPFCLRLGVLIERAGIAMSAASPALQLCRRLRGSDTKVVLKVTTRSFFERRAPGLRVKPATAEEASTPHPGPTYAIVGNQ